MFTNWEQVRDWITDNGFKRWILYKDSSRTDKIIDSAAFAVSDQADKLAMTEKYLRMAGGRAVGCGFANNGKDDPTVCEIRLEAEMPAGAAGIGAAGYPSIGELTDTITQKVRAEIKAEQYEKEKAEFERAKKEFDQEKQSALGAIVHYFAPIGQQLMQRHLMPKVAGVDVDAPMDVQPMRVQKSAPVDQPETEEPETEEPFTDEESEKLLALMVRFKAVEPRYLELIESVVTMAENGDSTYTMAKGFLLK